MLAARPDLVWEYRDVPPGVLPLPRGLSAVICRLGQALGKLGFRQARAELEHLAAMLAWTSTPGMQPYLGAPAPSHARSRRKDDQQARAGDNGTRGQGARRGKALHPTYALVDAMVKDEG